MKRKKVSELAKQIRGVSYKTEDLHENLDENSVTLLRANNIFEGRINFDDVVYVDKSRVAREQYLCKGDILVCASSGSKQLVGKAASFNFDTECTFGAFCKVVRPNQDVANYLSMYFQSNAYRRKISEVAIGANINNIRNEHIDALELPIGSNAENEKVVASFSLLQQIIDGRKQQLHKLDELIKSRFIELFGDPMTDVSKWSASTIGEQFNVASGGTPATGEKVYWENGTIPWIGSNMCQDTILSENDGKFMTEEGYAHSSAKWFHKGTVLVALVGATIGKTALLRFDTTTNQNIAAIDVTQNAAFSSEFVFYHMQMLYSKFMEIGSGKFKMANQGFIRQLPLICPPIELQQQFAAFVEQTDKSKYYSSLSFRYCQAAENAYRQEWITCRTSDF